MLTTQTLKPTRGPNRLQAVVTRRPDWVLRALALRYKVFADEMGATLHSPYPGMDWDAIDSHCDHLIVFDRDTEHVVGTTRLLNGSQAGHVGHFYSEGEFHLDGVLGLEGRFLEIGRTCVDRRVRGSAVLTVLWSRLAAHALQGKYDYLMGCASIPAGPNGFAVDAVYRQIEDDQLGPAELNVRPKVPVPEELRCSRDENGIPPLLQAYLRLGAWVCGEPCWDPDFNVMDVFILLPIQRLQGRYERHYLGKAAHDDTATLATVA